MDYQDEFEIWKRENEKDRVLELISDKGTIDLNQVSGFLGKPLEETETIVAQLEKEKLIKSEIGGFYHLTFDGYKRVRSKATERSRYQQR